MQNRSPLRLMLATGMVFAALAATPAETTATQGLTLDWAIQKDACCTNPGLSNPAYDGTGSAVFAEYVTETVWRVSRLDSDGNTMWAADFEAPVPHVNRVAGGAFAIDPLGNVVATGRFRGTFDFDPGPGTFNLTSAGVDDIYVLKLDSAGDLAWAIQLGGPGPGEFDFSNDIAVDDAGNVYTTGFFEDTVDFDPGPGDFYLTAGGFRDLFLWKLDAAGNLVWATKLGGTGSPTNVAVDGSRNVYVTGEFSGVVDFDPGPGAFELTSAGKKDVFVTKFDATAGLLWAVGLGGPSSDESHNLVVDDFGNAYTIGTFKATADFAPGPGTFPLTSAGGKDAFISKLDTSGGFLWAGRIGGRSRDEGHGIAADAHGNIYATGRFTSTVDLDPGTAAFHVTSAGHSDGFMVKIDTAGDLAWGFPIAGPGVEGVDVVAVDGSGYVYAKGVFTDTVDLDPGPGTFPVSPPGFVGVFMAKYVQGVAPAVVCGGRAATIVGTPEDDVIRGSSGPDVIHAGEGNDEVWGLRGDDVICGGGGNDSLHGNGGNDQLTGEIGDDILGGGAGRDTLDGGGGDDTLRAGDGDDLGRGGPGADTMTGGAGIDELRGGDGDDAISGNAGPDLLIGGDGDDALHGGPGVDDLDGGSGTDTCRSGETTTRCEG